MKLTRIETRKFSVPLKRPFKTALRTVNAVEGILVLAYADGGLVGIGEAAPTAVITGETIPSIIGAIEYAIAPAIAGMDVSEFDNIMKALHNCIHKNTSAKAAVDMALYDIRAQSLGIPLHKLLGGARKRLETDVTISLNDARQMVSDSLAAISEGYRILKIKVGKGGFNDSKIIQEIRKAVGPAAEIRVDANQGWTPKESIRAIRQMEDSLCGVRLVEQPVRASDLDGMRLVTKNVLTPILADESVFSPADAVEVIRTHAADMINIKLMKTGGIYKALEICAIAQSYGVECMMGCMLESKASVSAAAHLAAAKNIITMADLDGPSLCGEDPYEGGPIFEGPAILMTESPGIGIKKFPG
ncbi:MAG: dipeptide epimerase [Clostridiales bacterium]|jgi:o-succinylbenzoate synthase|nr:dipeptide epimerase [Clostridiales bacterium]